jgi:LacI family transcriptional regulator
MAVTIRDVARAAGVAVSTVSRVLNESGYVSAETRERVEAAVKELAFHPNMLARGLIIRASSTIALIVPDLGNPFFGPLIKGVEAEAKEAGFSVFICDTDQNPKGVGEWVGRLRQHFVSGVLFAVEPQPSDLEGLIADQIPFALVDQEVDGIAANRVLITHQEGARTAVRHLVELGHRRIAHIAGPRKGGFLRFMGYLDALKEAGIEPRPDWISDPGEFTFEHGYSAMRRLLSLPAHSRPSAVFCVNDMAAVGAMRAIEDAGLSVPEDLSVVGYDDILWARFIKPPLTTVSQPVEELGRMTVRLLLERILKGQADPVVRTLVTSLTIRNSAAPPREAPGSAPVNQVVHMQSEKTPVP